MHVLVVLALYALLRLGIWQWGRGVQTGSIRNYSYGLEWWAFLALTLAGWTKFCLDETAPAAAPPVRTPAPPLPVVRTVREDDDPELAAWNARFTELARRDSSA